MSALPPAIFLMGPTASGKTGVAIELVKHLPVELISVDSALVFRDMDIGTAKPDAATLARAPHHLIDIIDPTEAYSAAAFRHDALRLMADITARGKIPLLVGGTMLYFKALREGLSPLPQADAEVRIKLDEIIAQHGIEHLHARLAEVDAETAARLHATDTQRIQRAMEIYLVSGQPMSVLIKKSPSPQPSDETTSHSTKPASGQVAGYPEGRGSQFAGDLPYRILSIALIPSDRAVLHQRIATRFADMLQQGLVAELRGLRAKYPLHRDMTSMRCVGYRQAWEYLESEITESELLEKGIAATRQLAKRQLTWLRSTPDIIELDCLAPDLAQTVLDVINEKS
ncbi:tRNA (adenosine(37)-N6)-dimethylallyltransferase MiaA [Sideroxydans lithotrophicus]|uniref:tRNA dimethylallyltransferase n=1 Tax=Sideroxydans lithotrophicus (strain ES-1) TaxID=580332 RepID=D5CRN1_SIDLE|nr:tRNA (adenosine(37)-N6)-dimethylallyltransferase MiaA [Sideroxydans lithotrophicus]ADE11617.1 tRNA delta(2)-isopentenylpyrophosphate transferase [Sideroxydans lithotrophicus ES-1]